MSGQRQILLIEGKQQEYPSLFFPLQNKGYDVALARSGANAVRLLEQHPAGFIVLHAASIHSDGIRISSSLKKNFPDIPLLLIVAEGKRKKVLESTKADFVIECPFTIHKVVNRIRTVLLDETETGSLKAGPLSLDTVNRVVFVDHRPVKLTPRVCAILEMLMQNLNQTVDRNELYKYAWDTNVVEDMRTMDVHIRWLREAIEPNPSKPSLLRTVRGVGYSLCVTDAETDFSQVTECPDSEDYNL